MPPRERAATCRAHGIRGAARSSRDRARHAALREIGHRRCGRRGDRYERARRSARDAGLRRRWTRATRPDRRHSGHRGGAPADRARPDGSSHAPRARSGWNWAPCRCWRGCRRSARRHSQGGRCRHDDGGSPLVVVFIDRAGGGRRRRLGCPRRMRRSPTDVRAQRGTLCRRVTSHRGLGHRRADENEVPAPAALHPHGLAGDLVVSDLVFGLAVFADELHCASLRRRSRKPSLRG